MKEKVNHNEINKAWIKDLVQNKSFQAIFLWSVILMISLSILYSASQSNHLQKINHSNINATSVALQPNNSTDFPIQALTRSEIVALTYMREEEKLAKDVYEYLHNHWNLAIFARIARSETRHTERMRELLVKYNQVDPALNSAPGVFINPKLAGLYQKLITQGKVSTLEALKVGALIEEVDINDLDRALTETNKVDIINAYKNLRSGSYHHLGSFVHGIELLGETYTAQLLNQNRVNLIIHTSFIDSAILNP
ncbi:MAG: DUF2202 domain-containing protein [Gammaproteobacteria bacterium]|nr:DUF2202 domain-containing protein [Gammaproteobacteria bacterium]